jgi:hypothetical protein
MPAKDIYHDVVKRALEKDGWVITDDPLVIQIDQKRSVYIDLGAETLLSAEKAGQKIAVEIKSFVGKSFTTEFYQALGQFIAYYGLLQQREPERVLYLAIPKMIYKTQFDSQLVSLAIKNSGLKYFVYDIQQECIVSWQI